MSGQREVVGAVFMVGVLVLSGCELADAAGGPAASPTATAIPTAATGPWQVLRAVDGDTIKVDVAGTEQTVRLIGIDTPESVHPSEPVECYGPEASARTAELVGDTQVWLESDPTQDTTDQYGRTLAYVWLSDGRMVNVELVAGGYAREYVYAGVPGIYADAIAVAQADAQEAGAGLWGAC